MGFFNFLYKLSNIFTNKRRFKFFIVVGIVLLIFFGCSKGVFASSNEEINSSTYIQSYQLTLQENFVNFLSYYYNNHPSGYDENVMRSIVTYLKSFQVYVCVPTGDNNTPMWIYFYTPVSNYWGNNPNIFTTAGTFSTGLSSGVQFDCMLGTITPIYSLRCTYVSGGYTFVVNTSPSSFLMPDAAYMVRSHFLTDFLVNIGEYDSLQPTYSTSDAELQAITRNGFSSVNSTIQNQTNQMTNSISSASSSITNSIDSVENTLIDTTTDDSQVEFASESNNDVTSGFFTNLYTIIQNNFTANIYKVISFPIPFTNKTMTFSNDYFTNNIYMNSKYSTLVNLARSCWWFSLGYYVILDIYRKINKLKSGDLTNIENENITTDLL